MDLNRVEVIGRLTADPQLRTTPSGATVANFSVATNFTYTDQSGQKKEVVEYHNIVAWRKLAEIIGQYMKKGKRVYIAGRLQTRSWEGQDGAKKYRTEIIASDMIMLDGPRDARAGDISDSSQGEPRDSSSQPEPAEELPVIQADEDIKAEDIPF